MEYKTKNKENEPLSYAKFFVIIDKRRFFYMKQYETIQIDILLYDEKNSVLAVSGEDVDGSYLDIWNDIIKGDSQY